jgi:hypothetical protein
MQYICHCLISHWFLSTLWFHIRSSLTRTHFFHCAADFSNAFRECPLHTCVQGLHYCFVFHCIMHRAFAQFASLLYLLQAQCKKAGKIARSKFRKWNLCQTCASFCWFSTRTFYKGILSFSVKWSVMELELQMSGGCVKALLCGLNAHI